MRNSSVKRYASIIVVICLIGTSMTQPAVAGIISTETAIELETRQMQIDRISNILARENVQNMLVRMGVDPVQANQRVAALTNEELRTLDRNLAQMPAGATGVVEVIGIVAIVLVILELLNVTNFFSEF